MLVLGGCLFIAGPSVANDSLPDGVSPLLGTGILKRSTGNPCDFAVDRSTRLYWQCTQNHAHETVEFGPFRIELMDSVFRVTRDLSESPDPTIDELLVVPDVLPKLVTFSCFPGSAISQIDLPVVEDLMRAELEFNGSARRVIASESAIAQWEIDALSVYQSLNDYCGEFYCEFAEMRDTQKFWACHGDTLVESIVVPEIGLTVRLQDKTFYVGVDDEKGDLSSQEALKPIAHRAMMQIGCYPSVSLLNVPLDNLGRVDTKSHTEASLGASTALSINESQRFFSNEVSASAFSVYTNPLLICSDELSG